MKAVIIAAGRGSRLKKRQPKTLLPFANDTILSTILLNISKAGVNNFIIVVGYQQKSIIDYLKHNNYFGLDISIIENREWEKRNGISVLAVKDEVKNESFLLSMSDHIVSISGLKKIIEYRGNKNALLVDPNVNSIFDIDDATKVEVNHNSIINIGKEINVYNGIDCGVFKLNHRFFISMLEQLKQGKESITAAVLGLIKKDDMEAVSIEDNDFWIDIDTPESYKYAVDSYFK